jgi:hypothetical protein
MGYKFDPGGHKNRSITLIKKMSTYLSDEMRQKSDSHNTDTELL